MAIMLLQDGKFLRPDVLLRVTACCFKVALLRDYMVCSFPWTQQQQWAGCEVNTQQLNCSCVSWSQKPAQPVQLVPRWLPVIFFFPLPSASYSKPFFSSWLLLFYLSLPAGAEPPVRIYSHLDSGLTDAGFLAPGSNRPICALDEVMSGWLCAKSY